MLHTRRAGLVNKFSAAAFLLLPRDGIAGRLFSPPPPRMLLPTSPQNFVLLLSAQWVCQVNFPSFLPGCDTTTTTDTRTPASASLSVRGHNSCAVGTTHCARSDGSAQGERALSRQEEEEEEEGSYFYFPSSSGQHRPFFPLFSSGPSPPFFFFFCRGKKAPSNCKSFSVESEADPTHAPPSHSAKLLLLL